LSDFDAYQDEMRVLSRLSDSEIDRLIDGGGSNGDGATDELAAFVADLRAVCMSPPDASIAARHLAAIAEASDALARERGPALGLDGPRARRLRLGGRRARRGRVAAIVPRLAGVALAGVLAMTGLAAAGIGPAEQALERVGVKLGPEAPPETESEHANDVLQAIFSGDPANERCGFGLGIALIAGAGALPDPGCENAGAQTRGHGQVGAQNAPDGRAFGEDTADRAGDLNGADDGRSFGEDTSDRARDLVEPPTSEGGPGPPASTPTPDSTPAPDGTPAPDSTPTPGSTPTPESTPGPDSRPTPEQEFIPDGTPTGPPEGTPGP
jgi:hypothetical protein